MTGRQRRQFEMLVRVRNFGEGNTTFAALPVAMQTFADIGRTVDDVAETAKAKMSAAEAARADRRTAARQTLTDLLRNAVRFAKNLRAEGRDVPGFILPASRSDIALATAGRQFAGAAAPFAAEFDGHGMGPARLAAVTAAFEAAISHQGNGRSQHVGAKSRIHSLLAAAIRAVRRLDLIIANELGHDEVLRAQWSQLRRIEDARTTRDSAEAVTPVPAEVHDIAVHRGDRLVMVA